jgi:hypothetical protein
MAFGRYRAAAAIGAGMNHATDQLSGGTGLSPKNSESLCLTVGKMISGSAATGEVTVSELELQALAAILACHSRSGNDMRA